MFSRFVLEDGRKIETPWLDGVLERGMRLLDEWVIKSPLLKSVPYSVLLLQAIGCADSARVLEELEKAGLPHEEALRKAHSHLPGMLMLAGVVAYLCGNTWYFTSTSREPTSSPKYHGFREDLQDDTAEPLRRRLTEQELRDSSEFKVDLPEAIGQEATEHLLQAILAYDNWARKAIAPKGKTYGNKARKK